MPAPSPDHFCAQQPAQKHGEDLRVHEAAILATAPMVSVTIGAILPGNFPSPPSLQFSHAGESTRIDPREHGFIRRMATCWMLRLKTGQYARPAPCMESTANLNLALRSGRDRELANRVTYFGLRSIPDRRLALARPRPKFLLMLCMMSGVAEPPNLALNSPHSSSTDCGWR